jgi:TAG lipase / steryl ester hydrolase / phospholipase A2 / LPA acyltransferase
MFSKRKTRKKLKKQLITAETYKEWLKAAESLDLLENRHAWMQEENSKYYEKELIIEKIIQLRKLRNTKNTPKLIELLEEGLYRHHHDVINPRLYCETYSGESKQLAKTFLKEAAGTLHFLCNEPIPGFSDQDKLKQFKKAAHTFGKTALMLSGGATMGIYHLGVVKALFDRGLLPKIITGSSMGAIIAAGICTRTTKEIQELLIHPENIQSTPLMFKRIGRIFNEKSLFDLPSLLNHINANMGGDLTFKEAYEKSGYVLNISVSPTRSRQKPKILNYLSSPDLLISHSTLVSCAMPVLFEPGMLMAKDKNGKKVPYLATERWVDGTLGGDLPMARVSRLHNVNHYIVSQTNPHIYPFISKSEKPTVGYAMFEVAGDLVRSQTRSILKSAGKYIQNTTLNPLLAHLHSISAQQYVGDINIHPKIDPWLLRKVVSNPTLNDLKKFIIEGERVTWPKIAMIRDHTLISRTFDICISNLEKRIKSKEN